MKKSIYKFYNKNKNNIIGKTIRFLKYNFLAKRKYLFGDLYKESLEDILFSSKIRETYNKLIKGERPFDICKRCSGNR